MSLGMPHNKACDHKFTFPSQSADTTAQLELILANVALNGYWYKHSHDFNDFNEFWLL